MYATLDRQGKHFDGICVPDVGEGRTYEKSNLRWTTVVYYGLNKTLLFEEICVNCDYYLNPINIIQVPKFLKIRSVFIIFMILY